MIGGSIILCIVVFKLPKCLPIVILIIQLFCAYNISDWVVNYGEMPVWRSFLNGQVLK